MTGPEGPQAPSVFEAHALMARLEPRHRRGLLHQLAPSSDYIYVGSTAVFRHHFPDGLLATFDYGAFTLVRRGGGAPAPLKGDTDNAPSL